MSMSSEGSTPPLLVPSPTAARMLGISPRSLYEWTRPRGPIPVIRMPGGRAVRYSTSALQQWIEQQQLCGTEQSHDYAEVKQ